MEQLTIPICTDVFTLFMDASRLGIGAVLSVSRDGKEALVAYFSRQLTVAERNHSPPQELEGLGVVAAVPHFEIYLIGESSI